MFKGRQLSGLIDLKTAFNNADIIREGNNFDEILAGLTMQPSEAYDTNFVEDVSLLILYSFSLKRIFWIPIAGKGQWDWRTSSQLKFFLLTSLKQIIVTQHFIKSLYWKEVWSQIKYCLTYCTVQISWWISS